MSQIKNKILKMNPENPFSPAVSFKMNSKNWNKAESMPWRTKTKHLMILKKRKTKKKVLLVMLLSTEKSTKTSLLMLFEVKLKQVTVMMKVHMDQIKIIKVIKKMVQEEVDVE